MSFKHPIDNVIYDVVWYRLDSGGMVADWCVQIGLQEIPYHHMADAILKELEAECRKDADADNKINREDHGANLALNLEAA